MKSICFVAMLLGSLGYAAAYTSRSHHRAVPIPPTYDDAYGQKPKQFQPAADISVCPNGYQGRGLCDVPSGNH